MTSSKPIILITGANTGLGFEAIKALCQSEKSYTLLLGGRDISKAKAATSKAQSEFPKSGSTIHPVQIDIEDDDSISRLFEYISSEYGHLDILINNAGGQFDEEYYSGKLTMRQMWNKSYSINTTSTNILTHILAPLLIKSTSPKLIFLTSGTSSLNEAETWKIHFNASPPAGWPKEKGVNPIPAYRASKAGMNMMFRGWVQTLKEDGVKVFCISPGFLATGLGGDPEKLKKLGAADPSIGGEFIKDVVEGKRDQDVGKVIRKDSIQPW